MTQKKQKPTLERLILRDLYHYSMWYHRDHSRSFQLRGLQPTTVWISNIPISEELMSNRANDYKRVFFKVISFQLKSDNTLSRLLLLSSRWNIYVSANQHKLCTFVCNYLQKMNKQIKHSTKLEVWFVNCVK